MVDETGKSLKVLAKERDNPEIKIMVTENMSRLAYMMAKDFFKQQILKYHQQNVMRDFLNMPSERHKRKIERMKLNV